MRTDYSKSQWTRGAARGRCNECAVGGPAPASLRSEWAMGANKAAVDANKAAVESEKRENAARPTFTPETGEDVLGASLESFGLVAEYNDEVKALVLEASQGTTPFPLFDGLFAYVKSRKNVTDKQIAISGIILTPNDKGEIIAALKQDRMDEIARANNAQEQMNCYRIQAAADEYLRYIDNEQFALQLSARQKAVMAKHKA